jgi:hypothetical protein
MKSKRILAWPYIQNLNSYNENLYKYFKNEVIEFEWFQLQLNVDVFHIHWPETFLASKSLAKYVLGSLFVLLHIAIKKIFGIKIVWTVHNTQPHKIKYKFLNNFFYKCIYKLVDSFIVMNDFQLADLPHQKTFLIRHGMNFESSNRNHLKEHNCLQFGFITPYKNTDELIKFWTDKNISVPLKIYGQANDHNYLNYLINLAQSSKYIDIQSKFLGESTLNKEIENSKYVIINYAGNNSGVIYKALERGAQILTKKSQFTGELVNLFPKNIHQYDNLNEIVDIINTKHDSPPIPYYKDFEWCEVSASTEKTLLL